MQMSAEQFRPIQIDKENLLQENTLSTVSTSPCRNDYRYSFNVGAVRIEFSQPGVTPYSPEHFDITLCPNDTEKKHALPIRLTGLAEEDAAQILDSFASKIALCKNLPFQDCVTTLLQEHTSPAPFLSNPEVSQEHGTLEHSDNSQIQTHNRLQKPQVSRLQIQKTPSSASINWIRVTNADSKIKQWIKNTLPVQKIEAENVVTVDSPTAIAEAHNGYLLLTLHLTAPDKDSALHLETQSLHFIITNDTICSFTESSADCFSTIKKSLQEQVASAADDGVGTVLYALIQEVSRYNYETTRFVRTQIDRVADTLKTEPLDNVTLNETLPQIIRSVRQLQSMFSSEQIIPTVIRSFLHSCNTDEAEHSQAICQSYQSQLLQLAEKDLQRDLETIWQSHLRLAANRTSIIGKNIAILSAITLPQMMVTSFFGQEVSSFLQFSDTIITTAHLAAAGLSSALVWLAKKRKWM